MRVYIWDWVVRLCHAVFVLGCFGAWLTYQRGQMDLHAWCGYAVLLALAVRLVWALIGSRHARFADFVKGPNQVWAYLRDWRRQPAPVGHNPLGGYAVLGLLAALGLDAISGLFSDDEVATTGPLRSWVSDNAAEMLTHLHRINFYGLLALVGLHVAAILTYALVKRVNLIGPMVTGWTRTGSSPPSA